MTQTTTKLGLISYNTALDASSKTVYEYVNEVSGSLTTQNLGILDNFATEVSASIVEISGSMTTATTRVNNTKSAIIQIVGIGTTVSESDVFYMRIPSELDGLNLYRAQAYTNTGTSASYPDLRVQVRNNTKYPSNDALSGSIVIPAGQVIGVVGTVSTSYDDVSTDDQIKIYVCSEGGLSGSPLGLQVVLEYVYP